VHKSLNRVLNHNLERDSMNKKGLLLTDKLAKEMLNRALRSKIGYLKRNMQELRRKLKL